MWHFVFNSIPSSCARVTTPLSGPCSGIEQPSINLNNNNESDYEGGLKFITDLRESAISCLMWHFVFNSIPSSCARVTTPLSEMSWTSYGPFHDFSILDPSVRLSFHLNIITSNH
jgi:hypothetical protein